MSPGRRASPPIETQRAKQYLPPAERKRPYDTAIYYHTDAKARFAARQDGGKGRDLIVDASLCHGPKTPEAFTAHLAPGYPSQPAIDKAVGEDDMQPLAGIRVLDFGRYIAGPYCAALLGDYGADVIRVERIGGNEDRAPVPVADDGSGAGFLQMNRNKRSLAVSLSSEGGKAIVRRLVATADVVVANMPAAGLRRAGLDLDTLRAIKPDIILATATAFGEAGPLGGRVGFDGVGQAMAGAVRLSGTPDQPIRAQVNYVDFGTALHCAFGVMLALRERDRSGQGQEVAGSLLGTAAAFANGLAIDHALTGIKRTPMGNRSYGSGPTDVFRTSDGWIMVQVVSNTIFARWAALVERPDLIDDPRFADDMARGDNGEALSAIMAEWCATRTTDAAIETLGRAAIPAGPVLHPSEVMAHPQLRATGFVEDVRYPGTRAAAPIMGAPITLSDNPRPPMIRAPQAGEHSAAILAELGYADDEIAAFAAAGAVGIPA